MISISQSIKSEASVTFFSGLILFLGFILADVQEAKAQEKQRYEFEHPQMGTLFRIVMYVSNEQTAKTAADSAFRRIDILNSIMSDYLKDSELNRLSKISGDGNYVQLSDDLYRVVSAAQSLSKQTDGAFDITIGPYVQLWRALNRQNNPDLPDQSALDEASQAIGYQYIKADTSDKRIALYKPDMQLDLGGIAKGYAIDEALKVLQAHNIQSALIDAGGDITAGEAPPDKDGWQIIIPSPTGDNKMSYLTLILSNQAIATSGDLFQFVEIDGKRYSHIINPETGLGITTQSTVTVVAPNGTTADSYASALSVLGPSKGMEFIQHKPGIFARFVYKEDNSIYIVESSVFQKMILPQKEK